MRLSPAVAVLIAFLAASTALAADPVQIEMQAVEEQPGRLVVTVGAFGVDGKPLTGLTAANFRASLDGQVLSISDVQTSSTARSFASIVLLVDVSGSMAGEPLNQAKRALQEFLRGLDPGDQVALYAFESKVTLVQDFTSERARLDQAIARLTAAGDTALYDGVLEATQKASGASGRKLIVLLSDGQATLGLDKRAASIAAANSSGVSIVAVGLGSGIDRNYLNEMTAASGGRFLEAPTPASLRQAYADLALAIRSQYTLILQVPPSVDRSVSAQLQVRAIYRADSGQAQREIPPLSGAAPPPFDVRLDGLIPGQRAQAPLTLKPEAAPGVSLTSVEYFVDGQPVFTSSAPPFAFDFDPTLLIAGRHLLKIVATDQRGRHGETQLPFIAAPAPVASSGFSLHVPLAVLIAAAAIATLGAGIFVFYWRREWWPANVAGRVKPWAVRASEPGGPVEGWPEPPPAPPLPQISGPLGRVIVMDEGAIKSGALDAIREYAIETIPLTLGSGPGCDIVVRDPDGRIAAEEARLWVQKGRLVYHKLTTLSAMATEGVTSGWQILDSDEDFAVGPYRIFFRAGVPAVRQADEEKPADSNIPPDDASFFRDFWTRVPDDPPLSPSSPE